MNWLPNFLALPSVLQMQPQTHPSSTTKYCSLSDLLVIRDSHWCKKSKLDEWQECNFDDITAKTFPRQFVEDVNRYTVQVGRLTFVHPYEEAQTDARFQQMNNAILVLISEMPDCHLANTTSGAHIIRYLAQDLMSQSIFAIDPEFLGQVTEAYDKRGLLLLPHQEGAIKESSFSMFTNGNTLFIEATQYWKVINKFKPTELRGHDGLKIHISIDLRGAQKSTILHHFQNARSILKFHGFRKSLDEISF